MAVVLNDGKSEKAGLPPPSGLAPGLRVGGPSKGVATPCASKELPCGIFPMRLTSCDPGGAARRGSEVAGCVTQIPGSICKAPPVVASLIFCK